MEENRKIVLFRNYFLDFFNKLNKQERRKVYYEVDMLKTQDRISKKFMKHLEDGIYELRVELNNNIYRVFFIFDGDNIVVLFHGFQKKTQKTPRTEIEKAKKLRKEYYNENRESSPLQEQS